MAFVKSVSDWNSDLSEKSMFSLVLATTGIQQDVGIFFLQIQASKGWESKWVCSLLTQMGTTYPVVTWGALVEVSREGKADGEALSYQQTSVLGQYICVINSLHSNLAEQPYTSTSLFQDICKVKQQRPNDMTCSWSSSWSIVLLWCLF